MVAGSKPPLLGWHRRFRHLRRNIVFSSGANSAGADVICVHIVFREYIHQIERGASLLRNPVWQWPRLLHRKIYYGLACFLEKRAYPNPNTTLIGYSQRLLRDSIGSIAAAIKSLYSISVSTTPHSGRKYAGLRNTARKELELETDHLAVIMVGNDWRNKGVPVYWKRWSGCATSPIRLLIVSQEDPSAGGSL